MRTIFTLLLISYLTYCFGNKDSTITDQDTPHVFYTKGSEIIEGNFNLEAIDTSLFDFQVYNPIYEGKNIYNYLGNLGTAHNELSFNLDQHIGMFIGTDNFRLYKLDEDKIRYYQTNKRYSEFNYELGSKKEQLLGITHSQNINPNLNISFNYELINSEGYFNRQTTRIDNLGISSWFNTRNQHYSLFTSAISTKGVIQENGGIDSLSSLGILDEIDLKVVSVNLSEAENRWKDKSFYIKQIFNRGFMQSLSDSTLPNSYLKTQRFTHSFSIKEASFVYEDNSLNTSFYKNIYLDSLLTLDSIYYYRIENKLSWDLLDYKKDSSSSKRKYKSSLALSHQYLNYRQLELDTFLNNLFISGKLSNTLNRLNWLISGDYIFYGNNANDYASDVKLKYSFKESILEAKISLNNYSPSFMSNNYVANNFRWKNEFDKTFYINTVFNYHMFLQNFTVSTSFTQLRNYIFYSYDEMAPVQYKDPLIFWTTSANKAFKWNNWNLTIKMSLQQNVNDIVNLPLFITSQSLFYEKKLFKNALLAQLGFDARYNTSYYADRYIPALRQFFVQYSEKTEVYPVIDFFFNFKIKTAILFFKVEHLNRNLFIDNEYFMVPYYPVPGRALKFGISWRFFD